MVHKEGGGPASECKIEKNAIIFRRTGATHRAATPNVPNQAPMPQASTIRRGYISPAFSGAQKWADWLHNPCLLRGPQ